MASIELQVKKRTETGKGVARQLRMKGLVPAVIYSEGKEATSLTVEARAIKKILLSKQGDRSILNLKIDDDAPRLAMIRDLQVQTMSSGLLHVDFIGISLDKKVEIDVPVRLLNQEHVKKINGVTQQTLTELTLECLPDNIPEFIEVDLGSLEIGDSITVAHVVVPENVTVLHEADETVVSVLAPRLMLDEGEEGAEGAEADEKEGKDKKDSKDKKESKDKDKKDSKDKK